MRPLQKFEQAFLFLQYVVKHHYQAGVYKRKLLEQEIETLACENPIARYRYYLAQQKVFFQKEDFGTGKSKRISVSRLYNTSSIAHANGQLLSALVKHYQPHHCLELGTCLGISSLYLQQSLPSDGKIFSVEGCPQTFAQRKRCMFEMGIYTRMIDFQCSEFSQYFQQNPQMQWDFVFIDGNHSYRATVDYFQLLLQKTTPGAVIVFDDIHWSYDMHKAWQFIHHQSPVQKAFTTWQFGIIELR